MDVKENGAAGHKMLRKRMLRAPKSRPRWQIWKIEMAKTDEKRSNRSRFWIGDLPILPDIRPNFFQESISIHEISYPIGFRQLDQ